MKRDFVPTAGQLAATTAIAQFMADPADGSITIAGQAGTGKTTLLNRISALFPNAVITAPTNKAVGVLRRKGFAKATTLDRATKRSVYAPIQRPPNAEEIAYFEQEGVMIPTIIEIENYEKVDLDAPGRVLVVDEASMVGRGDMELATALYRKVIFVGDQFQLPPVEGKKWFQTCDPTVQLDEIVRTAAASEITQLAGMLRRQHAGWKKHKWAAEVRVLTQSEAWQDEALAVWQDADIVLAHKNVTCDTYNSILRALKGLASDVDPVRPARGDRLLAWVTLAGCGIVKSDSYEVLSAGPLKGGYAVSLRSPDTGQAAVISVNKATLAEQLSEVRVPGMHQFSYAHCITGHKSQGSEFDNVIVLAYDKARKQDDYWNWLYTCCSRAKTRLTVIV